MQHRRRRQALVVVAVLLLAACGNDELTSPPGGTTDTSETTTDNGQPTATGGDDQEEREQVALPSGGPVDQIFPPGDEAYEMLAGDRCQELQDAVSEWGPSVAEQEGQDTIVLYRGAAQACLGQWDEAIASFDQIRAGRDLRGSCAREAVFVWLDRLIAERETDPEFDPEFVASGGGSPCPVEGTTDGTDDTSDGGTDAVDDGTTDDSDETTDDPAGDPDTETGSGADR